jgi:hypothetical protein
MGKFEKGNPGGGGFRQGVKNKISQKFLKDLMAEWNAHGAEALKILRVEDPGAFCKLAAMCVPKEDTLNLAGQVVLIASGVPRAGDVPGKPVKSFAPGQKAIEAHPSGEFSKPVVIEPKIPGYRNLGNEETGVRVGLSAEEPKPSPIDYPEEWDKRA